ncbi:MAG: thermonuclease family protein [Clostridia bacterium]
MKKLTSKSKKSITIAVSIGIVTTFIYLGIIDKNSANKIISNVSNSQYIKENTDKTESSTNTIQSIDSSKFTEAYVKRVIDGDTIVVIIEGKEYKVRLIGVNTPESTTKTEPYGKEASKFTEKSLTKKTVYLEKDVSDTDKYNRLLRYVWLEIPTNIDESQIRTKMFNSCLLIEGYGQVATYPPDVKYVEYFKNMGVEARKNKVGLWNLK